MRLTSTPNSVFRFLKWVMVFLSFFLIVLVPLKGLSANGVTGSSSNNLSSTVDNLLSMLGGGGLGMAGSNLLNKSSPPVNSSLDQGDTSGFSLTNSAIEQKVRDEERKRLKQEQIIIAHQKKLASKLNAIEFFLGKKFEDFNRKDTEY